MDVRVKFGDSRSNSCEDILAAHFVMETTMDPVAIQQNVRT